MVEDLAAQIGQHAFAEHRDEVEAGGADDTAITAAMPMISQP